LLIIIN